MAVGAKPPPGFTSASEGTSNRWRGPTICGLFSRGSRIAVKGTTLQRKYLLIRQ